MTPTGMPASVLVVGAGLIGTSLGLALASSCRVLLVDQDERRIEEAVRRGAGGRWDGAERTELAVVAIALGQTAEVLGDLIRRDLAQTFTHVTSCQSQVERHLESAGIDLSRFCGGHPLAGREVSGPAGASAELFLGRPWVLCPVPGTAPGALETVSALAAGCGADPLVMSASEHDRAVALSSHLPQLAASALAARLLAGNGRAAAISGPGLQDTTRVAASDPALWTEVLTANAAHVAPLVTELAKELTEVAEALGRLAAGPDERAAQAVRSLLTRGQAGRALVPVKRGVLDRDVEVVGVRVPDQPGRLASLLASAAAAGINVEDVRVEHLPGRPTGVVEMLVRSADAAALRRALTGEGLEVVGSASSASSPAGPSGPASPAAPPPAG